MAYIDDVNEQYGIDVWITSENISVEYFTGMELLNGSRNGRQILLRVFSKMIEQ